MELVIIDVSILPQVAHHVLTDPSSALVPRLPLYYSCSGCVCVCVCVSVYMYVCLGLCVCVCVYIMISIVDVVLVRELRHASLVAARVRTLRSRAPANDF